MAAFLTKYANSDDRLLIEGLRTYNLETAAVVYLDASASVVATVVDRDTQLEVAGETWPVTLTYITDSDGNFHGPLRDTLVVAAHQELEVIVVINNGDDQKRTLRLPCRVLTDRG